MAASLPPSSRVTRFKVAAHACITFLPVATEPVKLTLATSGWAVSIGPRDSSPLRTLTTPLGKILAAISPTLRAVLGVNGDGFQMKVLPASRADEILMQPSRMGRFQGMMPTPTPRGTWRMLKTRSSVSSIVCSVKRNLMVPRIWVVVRWSSRPTP